MRWRTTVVSTLATGALLLGAQAAVASTDAAKTTGEYKAPAAHSAQRSEIRQVRGEVIAVESQASPMTLTLNTMEGKQQLTVGVDVTDKTMIREGKVAKSLSDIKVGDHVWLKYQRSNDRLVAETIRLMPPTHSASAKAGGKKTY
jgi:Cu/Ag efflux protein CusF